MVPISRAHGGCGRVKQAPFVKLAFSPGNGARKSRKITQKFNLAHPGPVLEITENLRFLSNQWLKNITLSSTFSVIFRTGLGWAEL